MGSNGQKEQKELSYHQVQQMIKEQIDRIEHETGAQPEEDTRAHNDTECNILAVIKRAGWLPTIRVQAASTLTLR